MLSSLTGTAALIAAMCYLLDLLYAPEHCPLLLPRIPYVGHIIGLLWHGTRYFETTSARCTSPVYTLNMSNDKVYVVTDPELVNAVNRNSKVLAFNPIIAQSGKRINGHDDATSGIFQENLNGENGPGYVTETHDGTVAALANPTSIESISCTLLGEFSSHLDQL